MAKKKKSKLSLSALILLAVALVGAVLAIVGPLSDWLKNSLGNLSYTAKLSEISENFEGYDIMKTFAYATMGLSVVSAALALITKFLGIKLDLFTMLAGLLTIVSVVVLIVVTVKFCSDNEFFNKFTWAMGPVLSVAGGLLAGVGSILAVKKN